MVHKRRSRVSGSGRSQNALGPVRRKRRAGRRLILVLGGAASGKSQYALDLARSYGRRAFVATAQALDQEMAERISRHRKGRGSDWTTAEVPVDLVGWLENESLKYQSIVLDCLTLWLSNLKGRGTSDEDVIDATAALLRTLDEAKGCVVVVTNELGLGLVPIEAGARAFRDLAGKVNQQFAELADEVHFVVSGVALRIK